MSNKEIEKSDSEALAKESNDISNQGLLNPVALMQEMFGIFFNDMEMESVFETFDPFAGIFSYNEDGSLNVTIEVPGIKEEDLRVSISDNEGGGYRVNIKGETTTATSSHAVEDAIMVPKGFKLEPSHHLENGILTLTFPALKEYSVETNESL
jgi:HSP20 family molecular chaperone IbpA